MYGDKDMVAQITFCTKCNNYHRKNFDCSAFTNVVEQHEAIRDDLIVHASEDEDANLEAFNAIQEKLSEEIPGYDEVQVDSLEEITPPPVKKSSKKKK